MSKKRKSPQQIVSGWTPFELTYPKYNEEYAARYPAEYAEEQRQFAEGIQTMWINNRYVVIKKELEDGMTWISIRHINRKPIRDWRHFQKIKNDLCGPEREAVEIYPAESRLVDEANQYHLWVFPDDYQIPFGFNERMVSDTDVFGPAKQRPFDKEESDGRVDDVPA